MKQGILVLVAALLIGEIAAYSTCTDNSLNFQGYTYRLDTVTLERVWSHCKFPNPKYDALLCGIEGSTNQHFVCDPDKLITSQVLSVDTALKNIQTETSTVCTSSDDTSQSYVVAMALINRIRIPDLTASNVCINDCGEIQPTRNSSSGTTSDEKNSIMANFATYLRTGWAMGSCGNDVVIFYCQEFDLLYISVGYKAADLVTDAIIADIQSTFSSYKANGNIAEGLLVIAEKLRNVLRSLTPAHILLIINMLALVLLGVFLFFFFHVRELEYNVWGQEGVWKVISDILYIVSGVWIIQGLIYVVAYTSVKAPYAGILASLLGGVVMVTLFVYEDTLFRNQVVFTSSNTTT